MVSLSDHSKVLLNADVGEGYHFDEQIIALVDIANIACGAHAGDETSMRLALESVQRNGKYAFAHLGYDDRENFGRVSRRYTPSAFREMLEKQLDCLCSLAQKVQVDLSGIKPHGALYHDLSTSTDLCDTFLNIINAYRLDFSQSKLIAQAHSVFYHHAAQHGQSILAEAFIDRRYNSKTTLASRNETHAVITDIEQAGDQAYRLYSRQPIYTPTGKPLIIHAETLCLHGDSEASLAIAMKVTEILRAANQSTETT